MNFESRRNLTSSEHFKLHSAADNKCHDNVISRENQNFADTCWMTLERTLAPLQQDINLTTNNSAFNVPNLSCGSTRNT